jgi:hypothetical protein
MRESATTHVEERHRELLQAPEHFATLLREHFFASFSSTAHLELGLWRNVEGRHLMFLKFKIARLYPKIPKKT